MRLPARVVAAGGVVIVTLLLYTSTLLPGFDFGDTGSFQATVGSPAITPRDGYPLYFAIGDLFMRATGAEPAHALNLASAVEGALACGVIALVGAELSGSALAGAGAALLFGTSYTFWSQAVITEVYALHMLLIGLTMLSLLCWHRRPSTPRLALFFALYALAFGNHLSMVLLMPAYTAFLLVAAPQGWRSLFRPRVVGLAVLCATLGAMQYAWNVHTLLAQPQPPAGMFQAARRFWFDVTKTDWRSTMVLSVPASIFDDRLAMYRFDLRQQFGVAILPLAALGLAALAWQNWRLGLLLVLLYLANVVFAFGYNVGDAHVFYLPSHLMLAWLTAPAIVVLGAWTKQPAAMALLLVAYASGRGWVDYPALDRSRDTRPTEVLGPLVTGLDDEHAVLLADLNWQVQNGLSYFGKVIRPELAYMRAADAMLYVPALVADNRAIGREVVATSSARTAIASAYGPIVPLVQDPRVVPATLADATRGLESATRYVLCILRPTRDMALDAGDLAGALAQLTASAVTVPVADYVVIAGVTGRPPALVAGADRPFRRRIALDGADVLVRMDAWLSTDTIRRMGFGHVIVGRTHALIVERGISFAAFDAEGQPIRRAYAANIFAPQARYRVANAP